jgi:hypothetical protein
MAIDAADPRFDPDYEEPIGKVLSRYAAAFIEQKNVTRSCLWEDSVDGHWRRLGWIPDWTQKHVPDLESR